MLFDAYRQFYGQPTDLPLAESFLSDRLTKNESVIFMAVDQDTEAVLGFVQLYPSFSSVSCRHIWILNDLFVVASARCRGVGRALLDVARHHALQMGAKRLVLSTAVTNEKARSLYASFGYKVDEEFLTYTFEM